jgi:hypothetical protein
MTAEEIETLGSALMGQLMALGVQKKVIIASMAGIDTSEVPSEQYNVPVNAALNRAFGKLSIERRTRALPILADQLMAVNGGAGRQELTQLLRHHGYEYINSTFVPVGLIDEREAQYLPAKAASELAKAIGRLAGGDESAAITSACGAIDLVTSAAYEKYSLGKLPNSFQTRVNVVMDALRIYDEIEQELVAINIKPDVAKKIADDMHETIKWAANALETIRNTQADAHGTKPAYRRLAYETVKWASAVCGLLEGKV